MSLGDILKRSAEDFSAYPAIIDPRGETLTYHELFKLAQTTASWLSQEMGKNLPLVGLCAPKNWQSVVALMGIQQAGASYVPIDPHGAIQRNAWIIQNCCPLAVLVSREWAEIFEKVLPCKTAVLSIPHLDLVCLTCDWDQRVPLIENLAFILYTSGSTGRPKGVQLTHQNALAFVHWASETFPIEAGKVVTSIAPFHFDLSVFDVYVGLSKGGSILLIDHAASQNPRLLATYFETHKVHTCYATPSLLKLLLRFGRLDKFDHSQLKQVLFAGEVFAIEPLKELMHKWPQATFYNLYGPTETNVVTYFPIPEEIPEDRVTPFPIGRMCAGATGKLWRNEKLSPFREGNEGELAISGPSVFKEYLGSSVNQKSPFVLDESGNTYYLTGDWVEVGQRNNLLFKDRSSLLYGG